MTPRVPASAVLLVIAGLLLGGCKKSGGPTATGLDGLALDLPQPPTMAAHLQIEGDLRSYEGPARLEVKSEAPLHLLLEDLALAEPLEIIVEEGDPVRFGQPMGERFTDSGTFLRQDARLLISLERAWSDGRDERIVVVGSLAPQPQALPRDWMAPGTRLFYGLSYDDKPITRLVPMGLMVTVLPAPEGGRHLSWRADVDPDAQVDDTRVRYRSGELFIPPDVVESGAEHSDRPAEGRTTADATSFFVPRQAARTLANLGAAAWRDRDAPGAGLLELAGQVQVTLQADDVLWTVPARVATVKDAGAVYVIADDPRDPLLLSVTRPGWSMKLMAIGRPRQ